MASRKSGPAPVGCFACLPMCGPVKHAPCDGDNSVELGGDAPCWLPDMRQVLLGFISIAAVVWFGNPEQSGVVTLESSSEDITLRSNSTFMEALHGIAGESFVESFAMIIVTELGDKTFFIAALLAMRNDRLPVFCGAAGALAAMTVLSAAIGHTLPALLSPRYTHLAAIVLFAYFGLRQLIDAVNMLRKGEGMGPSDELSEVEQSLKESRQKKSVAMQALTLTFVAEWGDRSQIATIALAAAKDPLGVTLGGIVGHSCCTSLAVLGGRVLASQISERVVLGCGGALFLGFAAHGLIYGPDF
eukprot:TRINITY_DN2915_c0_g1_i1.p1 TRINITY_DN2915_c0_g1~~TRINITY_DN2915_c0_g1_i1.p1  ORF type:complete len:324 (+),score=50.88 TRINITY_DN2915_c0_g1_i1:68-973(+)